MPQAAIILLLILVLFSNCKSNQIDSSEKWSGDNSISKVEMTLSAFGVESDDYPSIDVSLDFANDTSYCKRWYYNPKYKASVYQLSHDKMLEALSLLQNADLESIKKDYTTDLSDQPTSTTIIYKGQQKIVIKDYGLKGDYPLQDLYRIVYKL